MSASAILTEESWAEPDTEFRASLGMWIFLATEMLFFGGIFLAYAVVRARNMEAFAQAGPHTSLLFGTINTFLLITSSFVLTLALGAEERDDHRLLRSMLVVTFTLGALFLICKGIEYHQDLEEHLVPGDPRFPASMPAAQAFFAFYWVLTGLHAIHLSVGLGVVGHVWLLARRDHRPENFRRALDVSALYWHLIDVFWMVLYALLYLVGRGA